MFEEIGHHVEKIRRVGYGPLVLDVEPGKLRELEPEEVQALRLTAAGKLKPRRPKSTKLLPKDAGKAVSFEDKRGRRVPVRDATRPSKEDRQAYGGGRQSPTAESGARPERPFRPAGDRPIHPTGDRPQRFDRGSQGRSSAPKGSRYPDRSTGRSSSVRSSSSRPGAGRPSYPPRGGEGFASRGPSGPRSYGPPADVPGGFRSSRLDQAGLDQARPDQARPDRARRDLLQIGQLQADRVQEDPRLTGAIRRARAPADSRVDPVARNDPSAAPGLRVIPRGPRRGRDSRRSRTSGRNLDSPPDPTSRRRQGFRQSRALRPEANSPRAIQETSQDPQASHAFRSRRNSTSPPGPASAKHRRGSRSVLLAHAQLSQAGATRARLRHHATEPIPTAPSTQAHAHPAQTVRRGPSVPHRTVPPPVQAGPLRADLNRRGPAQAGRDQPGRRQADLARADLLQQGPAIAASHPQAQNAAPAAVGFEANQAAAPSAPLAVPLANAAARSAEPNVPAARVAPVKKGSKPSKLAQSRVPLAPRLWGPGKARCIPTPPHRRHCLALQRGVEAPPRLLSPVGTGDSDRPHALLLPNTAPCI